MWYAAFIFATTLHEAAHALAAKLGGDTTAYEIGQVTIDPIPHIRREPVGMVVLPIIRSQSSAGHSAMRVPRTTLPGRNAIRVAPHGWLWPARRPTSGSC